jgi:PTH1 family peptidyl-tRNA hydrolase
MKLIIGLGNPGRAYANNRHNIGFMCLNHFARVHGIRFDRKQGKARIGTGEVAGPDGPIGVVLARPQTFMNASGEAVSRLVRRFKVSPDNYRDDLIVVHDDLDLLTGKIRLRRGGSSAGHKGIESVIAELGTSDFSRVRVGIGRPTVIEGSDPDNIRAESDIINYVLSDFTPEEKQTIDQTIPRVSEAIYCLLTEGLVAAMNKFNPR